MSADQWHVVATSAALLPIVEISLRINGFKRTTSWLASTSHRVAVPSPPSSAIPIAEAVGLVARRPVIGARCLGRSLVLWFLLRRRGIDAELVLGAGAPQDGQLSAHAWVEVGRVPVNDTADVRERFGSFELRLPHLAAAENP